MCLVYFPACIVFFFFLFSAMISVRSVYGVGKFTYLELGGGSLSFLSLFLAP